MKTIGCVAIGHCDKIRGPTLILNTMSEITKTPCKTLPAGIGPGAEATAPSTGRDSALRTLVCGVLAEPAQPRRDDGRAGFGGRPFERAPLGHQARAAAGKGVSAAQATGGQEAGGWTRPTSRSRDNGNSCTAPSTRKATRSISMLRAHRDKAGLRAVTSRRRLTRTVSPKRLPWIRAAPIWPRSKRSTPSGRHRSRSARTST